MKVFSLHVTREHVLKMNVVLIKECVDSEWACESNTIQQNIHLVQNACMQGVSVGQLDEQ